jgi:hypothetical protein
MWGEGPAGADDIAAISRDFACFTKSVVTLAGGMSFRFQADRAWPDGQADNSCMALMRPRTIARSSTAARTAPCEQRSNDR